MSEAVKSGGISKVVEQSLSPVGANVSYALVIETRMNGAAQVVTLVADRPITVPAVGETFELQGSSTPIAGAVTAVNHSFGYSGGSAPSLNCTTWIVLV